MANKRYKNNRGHSPLALQGPQAPITQADIEFQNNLDSTQYSVEPAEVVDIILNDTHPEYDADIPDPEEQFGFIKVRRLFTDQNQEDEDTLPWAVPLTRNIKQYPLIHEIVLISEYVNKHSVDDITTQQLYYHDILNLWGSVHHSALPFMSIPEPNPDSENKSKIDEYKDVGFGNPNIAGDEGGDIEYGETFKEQPRIRPIQPYEGDFTIEGRFGHSIRFGSAVKGTPENTWSDPSTDDPAEPILIIRNGQDQDLEDGGEHVVETPDLEASSLWMTKGQTVPLTFGSTKYDALSFEAGENTVGEDLTAPTTDDLIDTEGERQGQILLTSNRLVFNSREAGTYIFGGGGIGLTTETDMTIDAGSELLVDTPSIYLNATEKLEIEAPLIYLGKSQQSEDDGGVGATQATKGHPLVLGDEDDLWKSTLCDIIDAMLTTLQSEIHPTPVGPSGPPIQAPQYATQQSDIATLKASLATSYSDTVWVQRNG
tara:strand:- start:17929 stop:19383 length:1455 start_codon:yes stop_codon:yes gene_type:complete